MSNFFKKSWYNICGTADFFRSRFQTNPGTWIKRSIIGAALGAVIGGIAGNIIQDNSDTLEQVEADRDAWVEDNANYKPLSSIVSFPEACKLGTSWYFAEEAKNGDYTLYSGSKGFYVPVEEEQVEGFVKRYKRCVEAVRDEVPELQKHFNVDFGKHISQPLRWDNTGKDGSYSFRRLTDKDGDGFDGTMAELSAHLFSYEKAFERLEESWAPAIEALDDGDFYDHKNADDVVTHSYSYEAPEYPLSPFFNMLMIGLVAGASLSAFSGKPNEAAKARAEARDTKRDMLNYDDLQF